MEASTSGGRVYRLPSSFFFRSGSDTNPPALAVPAEAETQALSVQTFYPPVVCSSFYNKWNADDLTHPAALGNSLLIAWSDFVEAFRI
jgi:hypothetical protein